MKHKLNRERRAVAYIRVPREEQSLDSAMLAQRLACQLIAKIYHVNIVREYADLSTPARWEQQTELQRLLTELAEQRDAAFLIICDYVRLAGDLNSLDGIIRRIHLCGAEIATRVGVATTDWLTTHRELDHVADWIKGDEPTPPYPLALLRAAHRGLSPTQQLMVTALLPNDTTVHGSITGVGRRLGIHTDNGHLMEDVQAEWVVTAQVRQTDERRNS